jgi:hypothetical protein
VLSLGVALGLVLTGPWAIGGGQYWTVVLIAACVYVGWLLAQLSSASVSLVSAPVLAVFMVAVILGVKLVRWPSAPIVGDGFAIVVALYGAAGAVGALLGLVPWLRSRMPAGAARTALGLSAAMLILSAAPYALAALGG